MRLSSASTLFFNAPTPTEIYTLSLHDALPISPLPGSRRCRQSPSGAARKQRSAGARRRHPGGHGGRVAPLRRLAPPSAARSEEHTSELQSRQYLVCRLLLEKKKKNYMKTAEDP